MSKELITISSGHKVDKIHFSELLTKRARHVRCGNVSINDGIDSPTLKIQVGNYRHFTGRGCYADTCADLDTGACLLLQKQKPDLCNTTTFDGACRKFCGHCSKSLLSW